MSAVEAACDVVVAHTSRLTESTYSALFAELAPDLRVEHVVDEGLLHDWIRAGEVTPALRARTRSLFDEAFSRRPGVSIRFLKKKRTCGEN